jgi:hypothetical protein
LAQSSLIAYDDVSSQSPATLSTAMQMPAEQSPPKQGPVMEVEVSTYHIRSWKPSYFHACMHCLCL